MCIEIFGMLMLLGTVAGLTIAFSLKKEKPSENFKLRNRDE